MAKKPKTTAAPTSVFVVAPDTRSRKTIINVFQDSGYKTDVFGTGREFLLAQKHERLLGVVVLSYRQIDMTARDFVTAMRTSDSELPVALVTIRQDLPAIISEGFTELVVTQGGLQQLPAMVDRLANGTPEFTEREIQLAFDWLTPKEAEVVELVCQGKSNQEIGALLEISFKTVECHRAKILIKARARDVGQLIRMWHAWQDLD